VWRLVGRAGGPAGERAGGRAGGQAGGPAAGEHQQNENINGVAGKPPVVMTKRQSFDFRPLPVHVGPNDVLSCCPGRLRGSVEGRSNLASGYSSWQFAIVNSCLCGAAQISTIADCGNCGEDGHMSGYMYV